LSKVEPRVTTVPITDNLFEKSDRARRRRDTDLRIAAGAQSELQLIPASCAYSIGELVATMRRRAADRGADSGSVPL